MPEQTEDEKEIFRKIVESQMDEIMKNNDLPEPDKEGEEEEVDPLANLAGMIVRFFNLLEEKEMDRDVALVLTQTYLETIVQGMINKQ